MLIISKSVGDDTTDLLGTIGSALWNIGLIEESDDIGMEEGLQVLHDFEIHIIKKRT